MMNATTTVVFAAFGQRRCPCHACSHRPAPMAWLRSLYSYTEVSAIHAGPRRQSCKELSVGPLASSSSSLSYGSRKCRWPPPVATRGHNGWARTATAQPVARAPPRHFPRARERVAFARPLLRPPNTRRTVVSLPGGHRLARRALGQTSCQVVHVHTSILLTHQQVLPVAGNVKAAASASQSAQNAVVPPHRTRIFRGVSCGLRAPKSTGQTGHT